MAAVRRKVRGRGEAVALLGALAEGNQTLGELCAARGIDARSLHCWRLNLSRTRRPESGPSPLRLVELVARREPTEPRRYLLHVADVTLEVSDNFDDDNVARLVAVVRRC